ncbi:hypothetical protein PPACK8108_LOCUS15967 [Phakopsora pachyrhizi]|uniref:Uncharacterized protein n=1 Tax=Phakopsora pachyrhizi TaxID=170000 RepID=A0AAV0B8J9_PHAPC|nr:hypothetical protein PPACK8108_LOCUS15967 [Phakopsora pachyrhizi]
MDGRLAMKLMRMMWKETQKIQRAIRSNTDPTSTSPELLAELNIVWNLDPIRLIERVMTTMMDIKDLVAVASWEELVSIEKPPHPSYPKDHAGLDKFINTIQFMGKNEETIEDRKELEQTGAEGFEKMIENQSHQNMKMTLRDVNNFEKLKEVNAKKGLSQYWREKTHNSSAFNKLLTARMKFFRLPIRVWIWPMVDEKWSSEDWSATVNASRGQISFGAYGGHGPGHHMRMGDKRTEEQRIQDKEDRGLQEEEKETGQRSKTEKQRIEE